jgi:hypothetical protein
MLVLVIVFIGCHRNFNIHKYAILCTYHLKLSIGFKPFIKFSPFIALCNAVLATWNHVHSNINQTAFIQALPYFFSIIHALYKSHIVLPSLKNNFLHFSSSSAGLIILHPVISCLALANDLQSLQFFSFVKNFQFFSFVKNFQFLATHFHIFAQSSASLRILRALFA